MRKEERARRSCRSSRSRSCAPPLSTTSGKIGSPGREKTSASVEVCALRRPRESAPPCRPRRVRAALSAASGPCTSSGWRRAGKRTDGPFGPGRRTTSSGTTEGTHDQVPVGTHMGQWHRATWRRWHTSCRVFLPSGEPISLLGSEIGPITHWRVRRAARAASPLSAHSASLRLKCICICFTRRFDRALGGRATLRGRAALGGRGGQRCQRARNDTGCWYAGVHACGAHTGCGAHETGAQPCDPRPPPWR